MSTTLTKPKGQWRLAGGDKFTATELSYRSYEERFAPLVGAVHATAFGHARQALIAILEAAGLRAGDEVILSPLTCKVMPLALLALKLKPVYVDISAETLNLDARSVELTVKPATRAILFQHTYGNLAGVEAVVEVAVSKDVLLIEDCAQCLPFQADGYLPGTRGRAAIFSNNLLKPLATGSGGVAITNDGELARGIQARRDRLPGQGKLADIKLRAEKWAHNYLLNPTSYWRLLNLQRTVSSNYRTGSVEAEITREITGSARRPSMYQMSEGVRSLQQIASNAAHRRLCCAEYAEALSSVTTKNVKAVPVETRQPLFYFPILVDHKQALLDQARDQQIELIAWPLSTPIYPVDRAEDLPAYGYEPGDCPVAENVAARLIGLPTHDKITAGHRRLIIDLLTRSEHR